MRKGRLILFILNVLLMISTQGYSQISPGILAKAHAELEGLRNCTKCHIFGDKVTCEKCLDCHKEIKKRIDRNQGYHASEEVKVKICVACHGDHYGLDFEMIRWETDTFNHALTKYELQGKHAEIKCNDCHKKDFISNPAISKLKNSYLGLSQDCLSCHADYHQGTLSNNCVECHNIKAFAPAPGFDHNRSKYTLNGKHNTVDCVKCHLKERLNGEVFQCFTCIEFDQCIDCHENTHRNNLGEDCAKCHTENSFLEIKDIESFNHDLTAYKLEGLHQKVACEKCHTTNMMELLPYEKCTDCHEDYHKAEPYIQAQYPDCAVCHNLEGFTPSVYPIEKHNQLEFPINGAHLATPCSACHFKNEAWQLRNIGTECIDCHENIHKELIAEKYYPESDCKACHTENTWSEVKFDHKLTDYELEGAHQKQTCRACHYSSEESQVQRQNFNVFTNQCTDCHLDVHLQQFDKDGVTNCVHCHGFEQWRLPNFDHSKSLYPLDGAHQNVSCKECHKEISSERGNVIIYKIKEFKCEDCHS